MAVDSQGIRIFLFFGTIAFGISWFFLEIENYCTKIQAVEEISWSRINMKIFWNGSFICDYPPERPGTRKYCAVSQTNEYKRMNKHT